jgi:hypothetical protein
MNPLEALGWVGVVVVLTTYAASIRLRRPRLFHLGNVVGSVLIGAASWSVGAWPSLALNVAFGAIGVYGLVSRGSTNR